MYGQRNSTNSRRNVETITEGLYTVYNHPDVTNIVECIRNKFYFATLISNRQTARSTENIQFFNIDNELVYNNFYSDFGPLNLACLYRYCSVVNRKLKNPNNKHKQIVHCTSSDQEKRANAAYLIASFEILYLEKTPNEVYKSLQAENAPSLKPFQDASMGPPIYNINLIDCLNGLYKAVTYGFFNFDDFDLTEYEKYLHVENGDLNWMVPQKFLAFLGPSTELGSLYHPPEFYSNYFIKNDVVAVVRLNKKTYDASRFSRAGIKHYDMFMPDGSIPPHNILHQFLQLAENTNGAIAVHCKAGLGRTGTLIAAYLMKHYRMSAREAIGWMRICRPGSVIGHQQAWLESIEAVLRKAGQQYRLNRYNDAHMFMHHKRGIYSIISKMEKKINLALDKNTFRPNYPEASVGTLHIRECLVSSRVNPVRKEKYDAEKHKQKEKKKSKETQGDLLNKIKLNRELAGYSIPNILAESRKRK